MDVLELFAGGGGAARGLSMAGWRHVACIDWAPAAVATLAANGLPAVQGDLSEVNLTVYRGMADLMWSSPPCQAGSTAGGRQAGEDPRNGWPWVIRACEQVQPTWALCENVMGWTYHVTGCDKSGRPGCPGCIWDHDVLPALRRLFGFVGWWTLDAADYGVPQHRRRVILWAGPLALPRDPPRPTHGDPEDVTLAERGVVPWRSMRDAVGATMTVEACARRACYPVDGSHGRAGREPWRLDRPAPTVTCSEEKGTRAHAPDWTFHGGPDRASDAAFLVAGIRRITVEEGLRLQGFPDDWRFEGTIKQQYCQVGNAVPPKLAEVTGAAVMQAARTWDELVRIYGRGQFLDEVAAAAAK